MVNKHTEKIENKFENEEKICELFQERSFRKFYESLEKGKV